ncbi:MAG: nucleotidyltransferase family protein [Chloroflexi bacterium]|nr:nucleotidyltransferase family protein [Chloroflexota bacterium]
MKQIKNMSQMELAAYIQDSLQTEGIQVVLSGGSAVSFYSSNKYVSKDLDLINISFSRRSKIKAVMEKLGFKEQGRYFVHPETTFFVEFPDGPLSVGEEPVKEVSEFELATGTLRVLSPTDCVKDRLCAFYFWNDLQGLEQAVLVAKSQRVDLKEIKRWSKVEGKEKEYKSFTDKLAL